jgi:hypothetical protein
MLVITSLPNRGDAQEIEAWSTFRGYAEMDTLKGSNGVFCINESAWLFDTRKAFHLFGSMIHQAHRFSVRLHTFQLEGATVQSHIVSCPEPEKLAAFIASSPPSDPPSSEDPHHVPKR